MDFAAKLDQLRQCVEDGLERLVPPAGERPGPLHAAMRHSLAAGGKRIRPVLLLATHELFAARVDPVPAAVAIECLHTYSLIHDDLPCMDNSPLRRGQPACHVAHGEALALLAGDALLTEAFRLPAHHYRHEPQVATELLGTLAEAASSRRLIGGQVEDTQAEGHEITAADLDYIHLNKTAAMIEAALVMGAQTTHATPVEVALLQDLGRRLGLVFQIVDDILDATSTAAQLGKTAGADAARGKNTYVKLHGLTASRAHAARLTQEALTACDQLPGKAPFLRALVRDLESRSH